MPFLYYRKLDQVLNLSGNRIKFKRIKDQNKKNLPNDGWSSNHDWTVWNWLRDHKNNNIAWIWKSIKKHKEKKADISDAGMIYADGNPSKFQKFLGDHI
ncbi:hypothetical protein BW723_13440 [Polaribacter reichenbachii]|uniref:Uncharacterized protein n=1 Tax=Polaribacter reichenbachii TaxID=996801 RepID=A0A1B8U196_9FLAO|nr:hypothetical protein [Polaribacter reichenbachii]APZ47224.1 hypothetical protein BW723_13440 [Polaribacter reichenbachii]AUC17865.1 hypothetical protein BTO17_03895 [Polaribacter reichenbachii]OBY65644.1 hypothetical protein LPB301_08340 [Polaribacter reichenbachii]